MKLYFQKAHGDYKVGDCVKWCQQAQSVKRLLAAGILAAKPPIVKPQLPPKEK